MPKRRKRHFPSPDQGESSRSAESGRTAPLAESPEIEPGPDESPPRRRRRRPARAPDSPNHSSRGRSNQQNPEKSLPIETKILDAPDPEFHFEGNFGYDKVAYRYPIELPDGWDRWEWLRSKGEKKPPGLDLPPGVFVGVRRAREEDECGGWVRVEFNPAKLLDGDDAPLGDVFAIAEAARYVESKLGSAIHRNPNVLRQITRLEIARDFTGVAHVHEHLEAIARYRPRGARAPNRSWGTDGRLESVHIGPDRQTGFQFYDKDRQRTSGQKSGTLRFEIKLHGRWLDNFIGDEHLEDLEPGTAQRVLTSAWHDSGFEFALVNLIPYLDVVEALLADETQLTRDAYLGRNIRLALNRPERYSPHHRKKFGLFDRRTGCRLIAQPDLESLLRPSDEVGYRLDLASGTEVQVGSLADLPIPIDSSGWRGTPRRRRGRRPGPRSPGNKKNSGTPSPTMAA